MSDMFRKCTSLISLPNLEKRFLQTDIKRKNIFLECLSLINKPQSFANKLDENEELENEYFNDYYYF